MSKHVHILGNGKSAAMYSKNENKTGPVYTCNLPPFSVPEAKATFMVDFKMMKSITEGSVRVPGTWILGFRPKKWTEMHPAFYMKYAPQIKEFYLTLPSYVNNYTDFNCGHFGTHYIANKLQATDIHMYGFDSLFEFDLTSCTDLFLSSDRGTNNNVRLIGNWRPVWYNIFKEFPNTTFHLYYHKHDKIKIPNLPNINIITLKEKSSVQ
jgi:hypothetical protein